MSALHFHLLLAPRAHSAPNSGLQKNALPFMESEMEIAKKNQRDDGKQPYPKDHHSLSTRPFPQPTPDWISLTSEF